MALTNPPGPTAPLGDLLEWADGQAAALAARDTDTLITRIWTIRLALEARSRVDPADPDAQGLADRITGLREAEEDLATMAAILRTLGGPIAWRATAEPAEAAQLRP